MMNFIEQLTNCPETQFFSSEDIVVRECVERLKQYIKVKHMLGQPIKQIKGYWGNSHDWYGFKFKEEVLNTPPRCNTGFSKKDCKQLILHKNGFFKESLDLNYITKELKIQLWDLGLKELVIEIYVNPYIIFKQTYVRRFPSGNFVTTEEIVDSSDFTCIYIEAET